MSGPLNDPDNQELLNSNAFVHNPLAGILVVLVAKPLSAGRRAASLVQPADVHRRRAHG